MNAERNNQSGPQRGIVIAGLPRSGTTLLRRLLDSHSQLACPSETNLFGACARFLKVEQFPGGVPVGVESALGFIGIEPDDIRNKIREVAFSILDQIAAEKQASIWVEKSPLDIFQLREIGELLRGQVKFICLYRHGLDVAISIQELVERTGGYLSEFHRYICRHPQPLEAHLRLWLDGTSAMQEICRSQQQAAIELRYEDLVQNTDNELRRLLDFIGVPWEPDIVEKALAEPGQIGIGDWKTYQKSKIDQSSIGKWLSVPQTTLSYLAPIANPTLAELGYPTITTTTGTADEARRYMLGLMVQNMRR